jgi:hypothetical protein
MVSLTAIMKQSFTNKRVPKPTLGNKKMSESRPDFISPAEPSGTRVAVLAEPYPQRLSESKDPAEASGSTAARAAQIGAPTRIEENSKESSTPLFMPVQNNRPLGIPALDPDEREALHQLSP